MVNLLFISNSIKIDTIKNTLQPMLKVKIDIVADFDFGLKDVFEKRPAIVFIQDHIAGVTGESVARHIQMLLGTGAPSFIFTHEGNPKAKPIKGLFEYLIDLAQADMKVVADIQATLKSLLGPQWDKIFIPPTLDKLAIRNSVAVPESSRAFSDQLVDDFLSDLDNFGLESSLSNIPPTNFSEPESPIDAPFHVVSSTQDQLVEMLADTGSVSVTSNGIVESIKETATNTSSAPAHVTVSIPPLQQQPSAPKKVIVPVTPVTPNVPVETATKPVSTSMSENPPFQPSSPADFVIVKESQVEGVAPEELLRVFEGNFSSHSADWKRYVAIAVILVVCTGGGLWYLFRFKPGLLARFSRTVAPSVVVAPATRPVESMNTIQQPESPIAKKSAVSTLPSFIPQAGLDSSFASQKPGWERYVDTTLDYRVYRPAGKIMALQVLGVNNHEISEPKLKSLLIELVGDGEYRVKLREQKHGYYVSRATVGQKAELLIYRKKTAIRAFVVSLD